MEWAASPRSSCKSDEPMILDRHREHVATTSAHASARPGARDPLHRHASLHAFLRGRELVRTASNTTLRPGVRDFVSGAPEPRAHAHDEDAFFERRAARRLFPGAGRAAGDARPAPALGLRLGVRGVRRRGGGRPAARAVRGSFLPPRGRLVTPNSPLLAVAGEDGAVTVVDVGAPAEGSAVSGTRPRFPRSKSNAGSARTTTPCSTRGGAAAPNAASRVRRRDRSALRRGNRRRARRAFRFHRGTVKAVACARGRGRRVRGVRQGRRARAVGRARGLARTGDAGEPAARPVRAAVERCAHATDEKRRARKRKRKRRLLPCPRGVRARRAGSALRRRGGRPGEALGRASTARDCEVAVMVDADPARMHAPRDLWGNAVAQLLARPTPRGITSLALAPNGSSRVAASYSDSHIAVFDHNAPSAGPACHLRAPGHMPFKTSFYVKAASRRAARTSPRARAARTCTCGTWTARGTRRRRSRGTRARSRRWTGRPRRSRCLASCADDGVARVWAVDRGGHGEENRVRPTTRWKIELPSAASRDDDNPNVRVFSSARRRRSRGRAMRRPRPRRCAQPIFDTPFAEHTSVLFTTGKPVKAETRPLVRSGRWRRRTHVAGHDTVAMIVVYVTKIHRSPLARVRLLRGRVRPRHRLPLLSPAPPRLRPLLVLSSGLAISTISAASSTISCASVLTCHGVLRGGVVPHQAPEVGGGEERQRTRIRAVGHEQQRLARGLRRVLPVVVGDHASPFHAKNFAGLDARRSAQNPPTASESTSRRRLASSSNVATNPAARTLGSHSQYARMKLPMDANTSGSEFQMSAAPSPSLSTA